MANNDEIDVILHPEFFLDKVRQAGGFKRRVIMQDFVDELNAAEIPTAEAILAESDIDCALDDIDAEESALIKSRVRTPENVLADLRDRDAKKLAEWESQRTAAMIADHGHMNKHQMRLNIAALFRPQHNHADLVASLEHPTPFPARPHLSWEHLTDEQLLHTITRHFPNLAAYKQISDGDWGKTLEKFSAKRAAIEKKRNRDIDWLATGALALLNYASIGGRCDRLGKQTKDGSIEAWCAAMGITPGADELRGWWFKPGKEDRVEVLFTKPDGK